jgi:hypothetical protein
MKCRQGTNRGQKSHNPDDPKITLICYILSNKSILNDHLTEQEIIHFPPTPPTPIQLSEACFAHHAVGQAL